MRLSMRPVTAVLGFLVLPLRAPMLLVLFAVSAFMGLHWADVAPQLVTQASTPLQQEFAGPCRAPRILAARGCWPG